MLTHGGSGRCGLVRAASWVMKTFTFLVFASLLLAREHTALNGTWVLEPTQSDFGGQPVIQTGTVTINERQGDISVERNFAYEGAHETLFYRDMTDSENGATIKTSKDLKSKASWDHDVLKVKTTQGGVVTMESYSLGANGTMTVSVAKPGSKTITLVFVRK
jgi:hypothetical protein